MARTSKYKRTDSGRTPTDEALTRTIATYGPSAQNAPNPQHSQPAPTPQRTQLTEKHDRLIDQLEKLIQQLQR